MTKDDREPVSRILVVDDSRTHRLFVTGVLQAEGYEVMAASDGMDALGKVRGADLVFLDITMPGMDGYEVCQKIRNDSHTARIPVVLLSGKDGFFDKVRGRMVGATDYLTKPCTPDQLVNMVHAYCATMRRRAPVPVEETPS